MNIDLNKFKNFWYEDENGNVVDKPLDDKKHYTYHSCFPCQMNHDIDDYGYHPKGFVQNLLFKIPITQKYVKKKISKTYKRLGTFHITYSGMSDVIVAMVNRGDYTLEQAIWICANACQRCINVLAYKYLDGKDGYREFSDEWKKCNTVCDFCRGETEVTK